MNKKQTNQRNYVLGTYGLTPKSYQAISSSQGNACAICKVEQAELKIWLCVDHDHGCCPGEGSCGKCVRGLLCKRCNFVIGLGADSIEFFRAVIQYLERHS